MILAAAIPVVVPAEADSQTDGTERVPATPPFPVNCHLQRTSESLTARLIIKMWNVSAETYQANRKNSKLTQLLRSICCWFVMTNSYNYTDNPPPLNVFSWLVLELFWIVLCYEWNECDVTWWGDIWQSSAGKFLYLGILFCCRLVRRQIFFSLWGVLPYHLSAWLLLIAIFYLGF